MEDWIEKQFGKQNPFLVPEGYFDKLPQRVMSRIPDEQTILPLPHRRRWFPTLTAAACLIGLVLMGATLYLMNPTGEKQEMAFEEDPEMEEIIDYTMMDAFTMHQYLTEASTDYDY